MVVTTTFLLSAVSMGQSDSTTALPMDGNNGTIPMEDCLLHLDEAKQLDAHLSNELISGLSLVCPHLFDGSMDTSEVPSLRGAANDDDSEPEPPTTTRLPIFMTSTVEPVTKREKRKNKEVDTTTVAPSLRGTATTGPADSSTMASQPMLRGSAVTTTEDPVVPNVTMAFLDTELTTTTLTSTISAPDYSTTTDAVSADDDEDDQVSIFDPTEAPKTNMRTTVMPTEHVPIFGTEDVPKGAPSSAMPLVMKLSVAVLVWWLF